MLRFVFIYGAILMLFMYSIIMVCTNIKVTLRWKTKTNNCNKWEKYSFNFLYFYPRHFCFSCYKKLKFSLFLCHWLEKLTSNLQFLTQTKFLEKVYRCLTNALKHTNKPKNYKFVIFGRFLPTWGPILQTKIDLRKLFFILFGLKKFCSKILWGGAKEKSLWKTKNYKSVIFGRFLPIWRPILQPKIGLRKLFFILFVLKKFCSKTLWGGAKEKPLWKIMGSNIWPL